MAVYLIQAGGLPIVKIGHAVDVANRIAQHQCAHWEELKLIRQWEGAQREERMLHLKFAELRIRGEWFSLSRQMLGDVGLIQMWPELPLIDENSVVQIKGIHKPSGMTAAEVIAVAGGCLRLSRHLGLAHSSVLAWKFVPAVHCMKVSELTGIPLSVLRTDIYEPLASSREVSA